jgi:hypothetical protein
MLSMGIQGQSMDVRKSKILKYVKQQKKIKIATDTNKWFQKLREKIFSPKLQEKSSLKLD